MSTFQSVQRMSSNSRYKSNITQLALCVGNQEVCDSNPTSFCTKICIYWTRGQEFNSPTHILKEKILDPRKGKKKKKPVHTYNGSFL